MLKSYIENNRVLIYTDPDGVRLENAIGRFALALVRADLAGLLDYVDTILSDCMDHPERVPEQQEISNHIQKKLDEAHPLFRYFYPLNDATLRRCFYKRLQTICTNRPALMEQSEFRELYDRIPFPINHAYLEEYMRKLQYAHVKRYYAEHVKHNQALTHQLEIEITYLMERIRSIDKFQAENPDSPEDILETIKSYADRLRDRMRAVFDVEFEPMNALTAEKRFFLDNLMHQKESVFQYNNYSISHTITVNGALAERFKKARSTEDYVRIIGDCPLNRVEELPVYSFSEALEIEVRGMLQSGVRIKKCRNCGHYFIPPTRVDEIYCNNIFEEGMTCRQVGYDVRKNSDALLKAYRTAYKTQHARMQRNRNKPNYRDEVFQPWVTCAKEQLQRAQKGEISKEEFFQWLENNRKGRQSRPEDVSA